MRKLIVVVVLVAIFTAGLSIGFITPNAEAKNQKCWYVCNGDVMMKCCRQGPIVECWVYANGCTE